MIRPLLLIAALVGLVSAPALARDRVALLIGNGAYEHTGRLKNPTNDVVAMYTLLTSPALGFDGRDVEVVENGDRRAMARAIRRFRQRAAQADTALLFFSGHGMEIGGQNYLIPTDAELKHPGDAEFDAIALDAAVEAASSASRLSVVIFDACRNNSFPSTARAGSTGFRMVTPGRPGQVIAFSTAPQEIAFDGAGALSPYTQALTEAIAADPSLDVRKLFTSLGAKTAAYAGGPQRPFARFGDLPAEDIALIPAGLPPLPELEPASPRPAPAPTTSSADLAWSLIKDTQDISVLERFRERHPGSPHDADALAAIERLRGVEAASAAAARRQQAEVRWRALETSEDASALEAFIDADPTGPFADLARERLIALAKEAQTELQRLGLYRSGIDGDWGPGSQSAMRSFQGRANLAVDGAITAAALTALRAAPTPEAPTPSAVAGATFRDCPECPEMVEIPGGIFRMGSPDDEPGRYDDEGPQRRVTIQPFAIGKYEVTFAEWDACVSAGGCSHRPATDWGRGRQPVMRVSWNDAQEYVAWLNRKVGAEVYRLPSEAEWEYAARAGTTTRFSFGDSDGALGGYAWYGGNAGLKTHPVGGKRPNAFRLHDMHGNVWEWAQDCWNDSYRGAPSTGAPWMSGDCSRAVLRGGSCGYNPRNLRSAVRLRVERGFRFNYFGFRVARVSRTLR